jgi:hypothetical protein
MACNGMDKKPDMLSRPWLSLLLWWLPAIAIVVSGYEPVSRAWRTGIWTAALIVMGVACLANATRCGRVHCYITGPFFLLAAIGTLLYGIGVIPLGTNGWSLIGLTILVGAIVLCCLPEMLFGKYRGS